MIFMARGRTPLTFNKLDYGDDLQLAIDTERFLAESYSGISQVIDIPTR